MLLILSLALLGILLTYPAFPIFLHSKPAIKPDRLKLSTILLAYLSLVKAGITVLIAFIMAHGFTYLGFTIGQEYAYIALVYLSILIWLIIYASRRHAKLIANSYAVIGIEKPHALPTLYDTLHRMGLRHEENLARMRLPDLNIEIEAQLSNHEIRFRVSRPIDKIFLNRLCRHYQEQYQLLVGVFVYIGMK